MSIQGSKFPNISKLTPFLDSLIPNNPNFGWTIFYIQTFVKFMTFYILYVK